MRHETFTAPKSHIGWVDEIDDVLEFLHHRVRVPGHDLVRGVGALVRERGTTGRDVHRARPRLFAPARPRRVADIAGGLQPLARRDPERRPELPVEVPALLVGLLVRIRHAHPDHVAAVLRCRREPCLERHVVVEIVDLVDHVERRREGHVRIAMLGGPADRFRAHHAGNPDGRMRFLERAHPRVDDPVLVVSARPAERARRGPRLDDHVVGLVEPFAVVGGIHVGGQTLLPEPPHEAADHATAREDVDHRDFLRDA